MADCDLMVTELVTDLTMLVDGSLVTGGVVVFGLVDVCVDNFEELFMTGLVLVTGGELLVVVVVGFSSVLALFSGGAFCGVVSLLKFL